jgi:hypothetical protein
MREAAVIATVREQPAKPYHPDAEDQPVFGAVPWLLTLTYDQDVGQVVLAGLPCGPAGEAGLSLAEGIELFFD